MIDHDDMCALTLVSMKIGFPHLMSNDQNSEKLRLQIYISECAKLDDSKLATCIGWNSTQFSKNIFQSAHVAMGYSTLFKTKDLGIWFA